MREELGDEARLADAGLADYEGDLGRRRIGRLVEQGAEEREFDRAADERRRSLERVRAGPCHEGPCEPRYERLALALGDDALEWLVHDRLLGYVVGGLAHDNAHRRRRRR
jgi:hypothetical protein